MANDLQLRRISIPDFIHYIFCPIFILQKEPVFPFLMLSAQQGDYWYHFYNVFGMTWSLTGYWTWDLPALEASTLPLGYRGGGDIIVIIKGALFEFHILTGTACWDRSKNDYLIYCLFLAMLYLSLSWSVFFDTLNISSQYPLLQNAPPPTPSKSNQKPDPGGGGREGSEVMAGRDVCDLEDELQANKEVITVLQQKLLELTKEQYTR